MKVLVRVDEELYSQNSKGNLKLRAIANNDLSKSLIDTFLGKKYPPLKCQSS